MRLFVFLILCMLSVGCDQSNVSLHSQNGAPAFVAVAADTLFVATVAPTDSDVGPPQLSFEQSTYMACAVYETAKQQNFPSAPVSDARCTETCCATCGGNNNSRAAPGVAVMKCPLCSSARWHTPSLTLAIGSTQPEIVLRA